MPYYEIERLEKKEVFPGFKGRFVHSDNVTIAHWEIDANAVLPEHSHIHEQIALVNQGTFELTINGDTKVLEAGQIAVIPSQALHSGKAVTDCQITDVFQPVREDYQ